MDLQEHNRNCKSNDIELKKAKSACSEINNQIGGISNDLNKLKQEDQNDTPADIGALEDDEERYQVCVTTCKINPSKRCVLLIEGGHQNLRLG